ncbi:MAG: MBOAT family protein [Flavobacteriales bacterium]|nr:MBOAT family protein [Flavobacteriales bacterium]
MLFNSIEYLLFLPVVFILYWSLNSRLTLQNFLLLFASYFFYGWWDWRFLSLIIFSSTIDYVIGLIIHDSICLKKKKAWLIASISTNLLLLSIFKYFNFFIESFESMFSAIGWQPNHVTLNIILPIGISFYTFQTMSYSIDIYRNKIEPSRSILTFFTYVAFFPQLVAGPIERASNLIPQLSQKRRIHIDDFKAGIFQIIIGLFRKIVIADSLGVYVDVIYQNPGAYNSSTVFLATLFYAFQIYFDFAGYSDIAIGTARLLGFKFERNFNLPYFSTSLTEFWRKWHISLSTWLRDYLYISLGGNRINKIFTYRNLMLTMLLGGLWHGSSWNFVIWGGIHGLVLSLEKGLTKYFVFFQKYIALGKVLGWIYTFTIVLIAWIFFRANNFTLAIEAFLKLLEFDFSAPYINDIQVQTNAIVVLLIGILFDIYLFKKGMNLESLGSYFSLVKFVFLTSIVITLMALFHSTSLNFIYFQF